MRRSLKVERGKNRWRSAKGKKEIKMEGEEKKQGRCENKREGRKERGKEMKRQERGQ